MTILRTYHHPDHTLTWLSTSLDSSASTRLSNLWITDNTGRPIQHLHYLPFGEDWVDQRNASWNTPYTFSGKEKDVETGYSYFGARYYDSGLSIWLSVDPMSDKYPSMSPYNYCANNPVMLVDPDGRWIPGLDGDNNVIVTAEQGDDLNSFKKFMGSGYNEADMECAYDQMQNGQINLTDTYGGVFIEMKNAVTEGKARNNPSNSDYDISGGLKNKNMSENYNCWGATIALLTNQKLEGSGSGTGVGINTETEFDSKLNTLCIPTDRNNASVGKTAVRYGDSNNIGTHGAIFMGIDRGGNEYLFSKNGWTVVPEIHNTEYIQNFIPYYGTIRGISSSESGYYNRK